jgi:hypothetical protein
MVIIKSTDSDLDLYFFQEMLVMCLQARGLFTCFVPPALKGLSKLESS